MRVSSQLGGGDACRCIEKGSEGWKGRRLKVLKSVSGKLGGPGYKAISDRLLAQALEGHAWHADHIIPVFRGGGLCDLHNLRTLCVACHQVFPRPSPPPSLPTPGLESRGSCR